MSTLDRWRRRQEQQILHKRYGHPKPKFFESRGEAVSVVFALMFVALFVALFIAALIIVVAGFIKEAIRFIEG